MAVGTSEANFIEIQTMCRRSVSTYHYLILLTYPHKSTGKRTLSDGFAYCEHWSKSNEAQCQASAIEQSADDELMRTYVTPAHMCCATSTAWKQVRNAEPPKTATGSSNTFPILSQVPNHLQLQSNLHISFKKFWGILSLSMSFWLVTVASWVSPRSG